MHKSRKYFVLSALCIPKNMVTECARKEVLYELIKPHNLDFLAGFRKWRLLRFHYMKLRILLLRHRASNLLLLIMVSPAASICFNVSQPSTFFVLISFIAKPHARGSNSPSVLDSYCSCTTCRYVHGVWRTWRGWWYKGGVPVPVLLRIFWYSWIVLSHWWRASYRGKEWGMNSCKTIYLNSIFPIEK